MAINSEPKVKTMNDSVAVDTACSSACAPDTPKPKKLHSIRASSQCRIRVATSAKGIAISGTDHSDDLKARPARCPKLQYMFRRSSDNLLKLRQRTQRCNGI